MLSPGSCTCGGRGTGSSGGDRTAVLSGDGVGTDGGVWVPGLGYLPQGIFYDCRFVNDIFLHMCERENAHIVCLLMHAHREGLA